MPKEKRKEINLKALSQAQKQYENYFQARSDLALVNYFKFDINDIEFIGK